MSKILMCLSLFLTLGCSSPIKEELALYDFKENTSIPSSITVDVNKTYQTIDKQFYGSHVDSYSTLPAKEFVDDLQLGKIRVGGNDFDVYNWKLHKTVSTNGEIRNAPSIEGLARDLAAYNVGAIFQINLTGFQPELSGDGYIIKRSFTAESAYEMIKHLNGQLKLKISDVSLGNEFSIWNESHPKVWPSEDAISADEFIDLYIKYAIAVRRAQEEVNGNPNSIKIWGPEMTSSWYDWNTGNMTTDCRWSDTPGQVACSYGGGKFDNFLPYFFYRLKLAEADKLLNPKRYKFLDVFSFHYYPNFRTKISDPDSIIKDPSGNQKVAEMLESTRLWNDPSFINIYDITSYRNTAPNIIPKIKKWKNQYYPDARISMNEFAVDSDYRTNGYHPIVRPLYLADTIGIFTKEDVSFLNLFTLNNEGRDRLPWALVENGERRDLFYMYKLFTNHFKGTIVEASDNFGDKVNAYAAIEGNMINLAVVNKDPIFKEVQIYVKDKNLKKMITYIAPGWSASIIRFDKNLDPATKKYQIFQYGAKQMGIPLEE